MSQKCPTAVLLILAIVPLLLAISALHLKIFHLISIRPELIKGSLAASGYGGELCAKPALIGECDPGDDAGGFTAAGLTR